MFVVEDIEAINNDAIKAAIEANTTQTKLLITGRGIKSIGTQGDCPTITLGDLNYQGQAIPLVGTFLAGGALITGGSPGYTLDSVAGSVPGLTFAVAEFGGDWYFGLQGTPTDFGSYSITPVITDANGCAITPREYTIDVWVSKSVTPGTITADDITEFPVTVSEISGVYGTTAKLAKIEFNLDYSDLGSIGCFIYSPSTSPGSSLFSSGWDSQGMVMTGADLTGCFINNSSLGTYANTSTGSAPYTGNWNDETLLPSNYFDDNFTGDAMNGTWTVHFETTGGITGTVNSITLYFKPL